MTLGTPNTSRKAVETDVVSQLDALHEKYRVHNRVSPPRDWYRIEAKADERDITEVWVYDEIGWFGVTASDFIRDLRAIDTANIELHINSPGGEVFDGIAIYSTLRQHPAAVHVIIDGLAASIASVIAMAGDTITVTRQGTLMIHDGMGLAIGNAQDHRDMAELLDKVSDNIASVYAERTGGDIADWRELMRAETWFSAQEALDAKLVDNIWPHPETVSTPAPKPRADAFDISVFAESDAIAAFAASPPADPIPSVEPEQAPNPSPQFDPAMFRAAIRKASVTA